LIKKKRTQETKICLLIILILFYYLLYLNTNNYFINFSNEEDVKIFIRSEFRIGETSRSQVEHALDNGVFGNLDCWESQAISRTAIVCESLASYAIVFPFKYRIIIEFNDGIVSEIIVFRFETVP